MILDANYNLLSSLWRKKIFFFHFSKDWQGNPIYRASFKKPKRSSFEPVESSEETTNTNGREQVHR